MITTDEVSQRFVEAYYKLYSLRLVHSKKEFCTKCNIANTNFCTLERGERLAALAQLCALVDVYHVSPTWLFTGEGDFFYYKHG